MTDKLIKIAICWFASAIILGLTGCATRPQPMGEEIWRAL